jgi:hypothetical protein
MTRMIFPSMLQCETILAMKRIIPGVAAVLLAFGANAQSVIYTFETQVQTPSSFDPLLAASNFNLSSGTVSFVAGNAPTATTAISGIGWNVADGAKWWGFTLTPDAGYALDLSSLQFDDRASATGPINWSVSVNGTAAISGQSSHASFSTSPMNTVDLTASAFQGLSSADVRIFGYNASGPTGTWRLDNVRLNGLVKFVPEPHAYEIAAVACLALLGLRKRDKPVRQVVF